MISTTFLQNCQAGDESAIRALINHYQRDVFQIALAVFDRSDHIGPSEPVFWEEVYFQADQATHETFVVALDRMKRYRESTDFSAWLFRIAVEVSQRRAGWWRFSKIIRSGVRAIFRNMSSPAWQLAAMQTPGPGGVGGASETREKQVYILENENTWSAIRSLNERLRLPMIFRYYQGYSNEMIGYLLGISEGMVHSRLSEGREKIASFLERQTAQN
jgi:RNA polymerase sigma factor (sigma-70 family)